MVSKADRLFRCRFVQESLLGRKCEGCPRFTSAPLIQFELKMDDCLLRGDSPHLVSVIQYEGLTGSTLTRLDQLVTKVTGRDVF